MLLQVHQENAAEDPAWIKLCLATSVASRGIDGIRKIVWNREARIQELIVIEIREVLNARISHEDVAACVRAATVNGIPVTGILQVGVGPIRWRKTVALNLAVNLWLQICSLVDQVQCLAAAVIESRTIIKGLCQQLTRFHEELAIGAGWTAASSAIATHDEH